jgi:hypothetical protein
MNTDLKPGDRVEVTRTLKGGFYKGRYLATVIHLTTKFRVRVRDEEGQEFLPSLNHVKKLG